MVLELGEVDNSLPWLVISIRVGEHRLNLTLVPLTSIMIQYSLTVSEERYRDAKLMGKLTPSDGMSTWCRRKHDEVIVVSLITRKCRALDRLLVLSGQDRIKERALHTRRRHG